MTGRSGFLGIEKALLDTRRYAAAEIVMPSRPWSPPPSVEGMVEELELRWTGRSLMVVYVGVVVMLGSRGCGKRATMLAREVGFIGAGGGSVNCTLTRIN